MDTNQLIATLARDAGPVRPLQRPWTRTAAWSALSAVHLAVFTLVMSRLGGHAATVPEPQVILGQMPALWTGVTAAVAAFATVVPGYSRRIVWLPLVGVAYWLGTVGVGAWSEFQLAGQSALVTQADWGCVRAVLMGAAVPAIAMGVMLRRGAPLTPRITTGLGALAAAATGNLGICFFHAHQSTLVTLFWHCGTVLVLAALIATTGTLVLRWPRALARL
jgi:hypothetical protein